MREQVQVDVAIVGGGASGTLTAVRLLAAGLGSPRVALIDPANFGRGLAYGTRLPCHLLNVPASGMSAFPEDPLHFVRWLGDVEASAFVPRMRFGAYLESLLADAEARAPGRVVRITARATAAERAGARAHLRCDDGSVVSAERVVLALGNAAPSVPPGVPAELTASDRFVTDPWVPGVLEGIASDAPVLLLGTGLTAIDVLLALNARAHRGPVLALSRRGLLPRVHAATQAVPLDPIPPGRSAFELLRAFRDRVESADRQGSSYRAAIDAIRPQIPALWSALPVDQRARLLVHARALWDVHRHRMAPAIAAVLEKEILHGRFRRVAGRIQSARVLKDGWEIRYRPRGGDALFRTDAAHVINCTGPGRLADHPGTLIGNLIAQRAVRLDPLGMGLSTEVDGRVLDAAGWPQDWLWTLGPPRRGDLFESTAMPEIRVQARALAARLLESAEIPSAHL